MGIGISIFYILILVLVIRYLLDAYLYILYVCVNNVFLCCFRCVLALHLVFGCVVLTWSWASLQCQVRLHIFEWGLDGPGWSFLYIFLEIFWVQWIMSSYPNILGSLTHQSSCPHWQTPGSNNAEFKFKFPIIVDCNCNFMLYLHVYIFIICVMLSRLGI